MIASAVGQGSSGGKKPNIYMGSKFNMFGGPSTAPLMAGGQPLLKSAAPYSGMQAGSSTPHIMGYDQAQALPATWSQKEVREFVNKGILQKVPGFDVNMGLPEVQAAWGRLVDASAIFNAGGGGKKWTPWDVLDTYANQKGKYGTVTKGDWVFDVATGERIKYVGKTTKTSTKKDFNLSSPEDVKALTTQVLRELLGRAPNDKELAQFKASINGYEKANPTVTTTTQQLSPDLATGNLNVTDESSTTSGGVSDAARASLVQSPTEGTKEYGKYQAATTYYDALMQMVGGS